jgi:hypothetical protein
MEIGLNNYYRSEKIKQTAPYLYCSTIWGNRKSRSILHEAAFYFGRPKDRIIEPHPQGFEGADAVHGAKR